MLHFIGAKMMEVVATTGARRLAKVQSISPPINQHPAFYRPYALAVTQPTVLQH